MSIFSTVIYDLTRYVKRFTGTAAPSTTPDRAGSLHFDTTAKKMYASYGVSSSADWAELGVCEESEELIIAKPRIQTGPPLVEHGGLIPGSQYALIDPKSTAYTKAISYDFTTQLPYLGGCVKVSKKRADWMIWDIPTSAWRAALLSDVTSGYCDICEFWDGKYRKYRIQAPITFV